MNFYFALLEEVASISVSRCDLHVNSIQINSKNLINVLASFSFSLKRIRIVHFPSFFYKKLEAGKVQDIVRWRRNKVITGLIVLTFFLFINCW